MIDPLGMGSSTGVARAGAWGLGLLLSVALGLLAAGCGLFAPGKDPLASAGPGAMNPYSGRASGALRLGLQLYNGCGVMGDGSTTGPGSLAADAGGPFTYDYPANCTSLHGVSRPATSLRPMSVVVGVPYFLDQFTVAEVASNLHTTPSDQRAPLEWIRKSTRFKNLDWRNAAVTSDEWAADRAAIGGFSRTISYGGAAWMRDEGEDEGRDSHVHRRDSFLLEILDSEGTVVASMDYPGNSFALENPIGGHTQFLYSYGIVGKPEFLGDSRVNPVPPQPVGGASVRPPSFRTLARLDVETQKQPFERVFTIPEALRGQDGVARVTWSLLPFEPFFFPLTFTHPEEAKFPQCWAAEDPTQRVPCDFGLAPEVTFTAPSNGLGYYEPGETFMMIGKFKDSAGNLLHPPDSLPSFNDFLAGRSNGLLYQYGTHNSIFGERAVWSSMSVQGPIQVMKPFYGLEAESGWFSFFGRGALPSNPANNNLLSGARDVPGENRWPVKLPDDAAPGTYAAMLKGNRQFMGERTVRTATVYFQVGQAAKTVFPGRVGNCDICHSGPASLSNIAMGMDSGAVEACKACHGSSTTRFIHQVHMRSNHYPLRKNDCTACHLTRAGVIRASLVTCTACHMQAHAGEFFEQSFTATTTSAEPNLQSACAISCHEQNPPTAHILPSKLEAP